MVSEMWKFENWVDKCELTALTIDPHQPWQCQGALANRGYASLPLAPNFESSILLFDFGRAVLLYVYGLHTFRILIPHLNGDDLLSRPIVEFVQLGASGSWLVTNLSRVHANSLQQDVFDNGVLCWRI